ncbi:MAG: phosphate acetyltransferase [Polyangiales bacterium]
MAHTFFLVPSGSHVGLTSVALGLVHALDKRGIRVAFFKPIGQPGAHDQGPERSTHFVANTTALRPTLPIPLAEAEQLMSKQRTEELLERVIANFAQCTQSPAADVVIVEGLIQTPDSPIEDELNLLLLQTLSADVIVVGALHDGKLPELVSRLRLTAERYGGDRGVLGAIVNRVPNPSLLAPAALRGALLAALEKAGSRAIPLLGAVAENADLGTVRASDVAAHLGAQVLNAGEPSRRVRRISLLARSVPNVVPELLPGSLLVTPSDRSDVVLAIALAALQNIPVAGLVLTGEDPLPPAILGLCAPALATGVPVYSSVRSTWDTAHALMHLSKEIPADDLERARMTQAHIADHLDADWLQERSSAPAQVRLSPAAFCYRLVEAAAKSGAKIVLPEGNEPRTVKAAIQCTERKIARCILLADPAEVDKVARGLELTVPPGLEIVDPAAIRGKYVAKLVEMRKHKGVTEREAAEMLEDNVWLGTMMLALGEVGGLVSGAVHSTANTIRPALQIIKTKPGVSVVSSVFFMCLPDQVVVYGDCAVNPDPDAKTLADIALQSAESAARFGIEPRVAMLSYSTGESGSGSDVDKVREATKLARERRPDLLLDGPLQYDAAANADVARAKAPKSPVAGRATVFVFPDLNTGNTTYKAVQRSADVVSIGPMLQGMRRPVNDLSRGALVEDIVYTIALTAVQAGSEPAQ